MKSIAALSEGIWLDHGELLDMIAAYAPILTGNEIRPHKEEAMAKIVAKRKDEPDK